VEEGWLKAASCKFGGVHCAPHTCLADKMGRRVEGIRREILAYWFRDDRRTGRADEATKAMGNSAWPIVALTGIMLLLCLKYGMLDRFV
jgi:hypothetical protein